MAAGRSLRDLARTSLADVGIGPKLRERLEAAGIGNVLDLLQHYPRRYHDRTKRAQIADLPPGEEATVVGEVVRVHGRRTRQGRALVELTITDGTSPLAITFFNQAWRERQLPIGTEAAFFGKVEAYRGKLQMTNPVVDVLTQLGEKTGVVVPLYPQSAKADLVSWQVRDAVQHALDAVLPLAEPLDAAIRAALKLNDRTTAYDQVHRPRDIEASRQAQRRLRFDEFFRMQLALVRRKRLMEASATGIEHVVHGELLDRFLAHLPYELTAGQAATVDAIAVDMAKRAPMHRLLQGEVGSGKTVVALAALLMAVQSGAQGAFMAPTEVLAEQHFAVLTQLLDGLSVPAGEGILFDERPVRVALLTNRTTAAERRRLSADLAAGEIDIVVGTHALIYGDVPFHRLGLAVIDEQHRFGVEQRAVLKDREPTPDVLVMTATPIPRTAGMLIYGDLDKSELRELPGGRRPITTEWLPADTSEPAYAALRDEVAAGHQAYVVCPLVEGSTRVEAKAATGEFERLQAEELAGLRLGLLHGQMKAAEKEDVMRAFRSGELDVLVATTVIEVGVDVPNATVMVIEDADRFGLLQLHQLRGRVGRGGAASTCFLIATPTTGDGEARMEAMVASTDGFELAERDLEIRGAGQVFGERQSGMGDLKLGRLPRDTRYVEHARKTAEQVLDADPELVDHPQLREEVEDLLGDDVEYLFKS